VTLRSLSAKAGEPSGIHYGFAETRYSISAEALSVRVIDSEFAETPEEVIGALAQSPRMAGSGLCVLRRLRCSKRS